MDEKKERSPAFPVASWGKKKKMKGRGRAFMSSPYVEKEKKGETSPPDGERRRRVFWSYLNSTTRGGKKKKKERTHHLGREKREGGVFITLLR